MHPRSIAIFASLLAAAASVEAFGVARVVNKCPFAVSLWTVGETTEGPFVLCDGGGSYAEPMTIDPISCGRSIKITIPEDGLYTAAPQMNFAYNLDGDDVWYDLSDVFGHPFAGHRATLASDNCDCPSLEWMHGVPPPESQVRSCYSPADDVILTLCA